MATLVAVWAVCASGVCFVCAFTSVSAGVCCATFFFLVYAVLVAVFTAVWCMPCFVVIDGFVLCLFHRVLRLFLFFMLLCQLSAAWSIPRVLWLLCLMLLLPCLLVRARVFRCVCCLVNAYLLFLCVVPVLCTRASNSCVHYCYVSAMVFRYIPGRSFDYLVSLFTFVFSRAHLSRLCILPVSGLSAASVCRCCCVSLSAAAVSSVFDWV